MADLLSMAKLELDIFPLLAAALFKWVGGTIAAMVEQIARAPLVRIVRKFVVVVNLLLAIVVVVFYLFLSLLLDDWIIEWVGDAAPLPRQNTNSPCLAALIERANLFLAAVGSNRCADFAARNTASTNGAWAN
eukprot:CAMPEP_0113584928 /NCGR_PEP_ID=MMETSP0015_2-20120614/33380_1 /TAXON_ID=2838 /ORGANISM="Odontella" /LENGTH=132 /DNA_ID=CAMNT_0000490041 /DNA_START=36 /DNA_END=434 /DNA_ORIENTATION=- /assembly_acc=CAM_ASM_000160